MLKSKFANNVFISYRHEGGDIAANHLAEKLKKNGYKVTFDKHSIEGGPFPKQIFDYIHDCRDFIVILSKNVFEKTLRGEPLENDWLRIELAYAINLEKNIIPITLKEYEEPKEQLPKDIANIKDIQQIKYDVDNFETFYTKLCSKKYLKSNNLCRKYWKYATGIIAFLFTLALMFYIGEHIQSMQTKLLFVGGGSVSNLIDELAGQEGGTSFIRKYTNSMYLNLPTEKAWSVLEEEMFKDHNIRELNGYVPLCLSAEELNHDFVNSIQNKCDDFKCVIGIYLGPDTLRVYIKDDPAIREKFGIHDEKTVITLENLSRIIATEKNDTNTIIWSTSPTSGTLKLYDEKLKVDVVDLAKKGTLKRFYDNMEISTIDPQKNHVFLGSRYYYPKSLNYCSFPIEGGINKPMYLYFVAFKDKDKNYAIIPEPIIDFLKAIHVEEKKLIKKKAWDQLKEGSFFCERHDITLIK